MLPEIVIGNRLIPMYGVCMALGVLCAGCAAFFRVRRAGGSTDSFFVIAACAFGGGIIGAKLLFIPVTYSLQQIAARVRALDLTLLTEGGIVFYGGLLGGIGGAFLGARIAKAAPALYCDAMVPCIALGHCFGRIGCFFAGCCYGIPYEGPFAVTRSEAGQGVSVFPVQLLEAALNLGLFFLLCAYVKKHGGRYRVLYAYFLSYGVVRFALEFLRGDAVRGIWGGLSTSQWISLGLGLFGALMLVLTARQGDARRARS